MNLQQQAQNEKERHTRSKLEAHREAILTLRRKHWTYEEITQWLNERGVKTALTSVYRFCQQAIARRPRNSASEVTNEKSIFIPTPQPQTNKPMPMTKHRFNLDI